MAMAYPIGGLAVDLEGRKRAADGCTRRRDGGVTVDKELGPADVTGAGRPSPSRLRRIVLLVATLNLAYFFVEFSVALAAGSVSLLADSVDFLEDAAINLLIFAALGWPLARRAVMGKVMAVVILGPAVVAGWTAVQRFSHPVAPDVVPLVLASLGAILVNGTSAWLLATVRNRGGSLSRAAFLSARNDVLVNIAIIGMAVVTAWTASGWPDLLLGCLIIVLALHAAYEVWKVSEEERLAAKALSGDEIG